VAEQREDDHGQATGESWSSKYGASCHPLVLRMSACASGQPGRERRRSSGRGSTGHRQPPNRLGEGLGPPKVDPCQLAGPDRTTGQVAVPVW
jgi:hypothetical protein